VRKVVEARRIAAQGGPDAEPTHTQALPPLNEKKDLETATENQKGGEGKHGFWRKLKCW